MSFDYEKHKGHGGDDVQWTAYSDLFMGLAVIFLLLYVTASLKTGTTGVQQIMEKNRLTQQIQDLKQQLKVYNTLKQDYMETGATQDETQMYKELMDKLSLLQEEAKTEKNELRKQATENEAKERALNQYQQMVRNIVNSNMIASARIKRRDTIIEKKEDVIQDQNQEIGVLEQDVEEKKQAIAKREKTISQLNTELEDKMDDLQESLEKQEITKRSFEIQTARLQADTRKRLDELKEEKALAESQLQDTSSKLQEINKDLEKAKGTIAKVETEKENLKAEVQGASAKAKAEMDRLQGEFDAARAKERAEFEKALTAEKLSGAQRAAREAKFKAEAEKKSKELDQKLAGLQSKLGQTQGELAKAKEAADATKKLARDIKAQFAKAGIKADVDEGTGDVILDFGAHYFDTGKANLKPQMKEILERAMPLYSRSLFENKKIADKIKSVEIVGFASPTYKGKYVDPESLRPDDRSAVDFNLDLSFARARSIFKHIFDTKQMTFEHQRELLPLVKVTGRSFLAEAKRKRDTASATKKNEFCDERDCARAQRVIIKFTLDN